MKDLIRLYTVSPDEIHISGYDAENVVVITVVVVVSVSLNQTRALHILCSATIVSNFSSYKQPEATFAFLAILYHKQKLPSTICQGFF